MDIMFFWVALFMYTDDYSQQVGAYRSMADCEEVRIELARQDRWLRDNTICIPQGKMK